MQSVDEGEIDHKTSTVWIRLALLHSCWLRPMHTNSIAFCTQMTPICKSSDCVVIFFWSPGIMECTWMLFTFENGVPLMRQGRQWFGIINYYWWTASIKPRLLFSGAGHASWGLYISSVLLLLNYLITNKARAIILFRTFLFLVASSQEAPHATEFPNIYTVMVDWRRTEDMNALVVCILNVWWFFFRSLVNRLLRHVYTSTRNMAGAFANWNV